MFMLKIKPRVVQLACIVSVLTGSPLLADDTEVYLGDLSFSTNIQPNVLFIIDTSGSMGGDVTITTGTYNPATTYSGSCDSNHIYWSSNGEPPSCSTSNYIEASSNNCDDSQTALSSSGPGYYTGTLARYNLGSCWWWCSEDRWSTLSSWEHTEVVDCAADYGVHGDGGASTYPADEYDGGPYISSSGSAINWNSTGGVYTLYSPNYINWINSPGVVTTKTRLEIVRDVFKDLVDSTSGVNIALMRYDNKSKSYNKGGYFLLPMQSLDSTSRPLFKTAADNLTTGGYTPLAETMYEATRFFRGEHVEFGDNTSPGTNHPGVLDPSDTAHYKSPISYQCQQNYTVLLTDGEPTYDYNADGLIAALPGLTATSGTCDYYDGDDCLDEVTQYLFDYDQRSDLDGDQNVTTYTIGFTTDQQLLQDAANKGGGKYYTADNAIELTNAFTSIISDILAVNTTFVAPAVPVNAFNRLTHRDELYFALFRPAKYPQWRGNMKRYQLAGTPPIIVDSAGNPAVEATTGFFADGTTSFWTSGTDAPDGEDVVKGGAAAELTLSRNLYTYTAAAVPSDVTLSSTDHVFSETNTLLTKALLGDSGMSDTYRTNLIKWSRGVDILDSDEDGVTTDARRMMGDPLHSTPMLVNYGGTNTSPDTTLFFATNEGMLHAIDTTDGSEQFAFIPQELLPNLDLLFNNNSANSHPYGLDGPLTVWVNDLNNNGVLQDASNNTETGEFVYLYVGMRRGGKNYYALDVTDRSAPVLKWVIKGGQGDFTQLAQSWSKMELAQIKSGGNKKEVLIFGGGYDTNQDTESAGPDSEGNALYMVDASTGARIWWAGESSSGADLTSADMLFGLPAPVASGDIDADGYTDFVFATDMGGQVWRFDFDNSGSNTTITGGVVAKLAGTGTGERRRLYVKPDVSLIKLNSGVHYAVALGSGYRAHPLSTVTQDRFHMLFFDDVYTPPTTYTAIDESDLEDVTSNLTPDLSSSSGWRMDLESGEKVMANSITVDGMVLFTTYKPDSSPVNSCAPSQGIGRLYAVSSFDATPLKNLDGIGTVASLTVTDRYKTLVRGGIQPEPRLIFTDADRPVLVVGPEKIEDINMFNPIKRTSWTD